MPRLGWRWVVAGGRIAAMLGWFGTLIVPHLLLSRLRRRALVPPLFLAGIGRIAGLRLRLEGRPVPGRPLLLISNHLSWLDILALASAVRAAFVAKSSLADKALLRWLCEQNSTVFIARERRGSVSNQVGQVRAALGRRVLVIFPEGTTGDGETLLPFMSALLSAAERSGGPGHRARSAPIVQPVALDYHAAPEIAWTGEEGGLSNVLRVLGRLRPVRLTIRFLPPLAGEQMADRKAMAAAAQEAIAGALRL